MLRILIFFVYLSQSPALNIENASLGCFKDLHEDVHKVAIGQYRLKENCIRDCFQKYYRYSYVYNDGKCVCSNYLAEQVANITCKNCYTCEYGANLVDIYSTGNTRPGPPRNLRITNVTDRSLRISWEEPESFIEITNYLIKSIVLHTYSSYSPTSPEYLYPNNTFQTELITLLPSTKYNITLSARSPDGDGALVYQVIGTKLSDPDNLPDQPTILKREGAKIIVKLMATPNNNGPVSAYRIIVMNSDIQQGFDRDSLMSYYDASKNGLAYYVAAEIDPKDINRDFVVGDGENYGKYYNAPLDPSTNYNIILAVVSRLNDTEKVAYSDPSVTGNGLLILDVDTEQSSPEVIIGLSVAIGLLTFMLIAGIIGFIILKSKIVNRRHRLSDNQELTLQGPMIEVENNGYIHEDDIVPVNHYRNLKQRVRIISSNQLKVEPTNLLGVGKFGRVNTGTLQENDTLIPVAVYSIQDKKMPQETRKFMLQDLDVLIKVGKHENLVCLIGTYETSQMVCVVLEYTSMNLKDLLLGSRDSLPGRFSNMTENQALDIAVQIAMGMAHLESCKIMHKQLCARSIMIANGSTPKIGSFGIAQYFSHNKIPDYTRWTALEVFKSHLHNPKSDVWSFACVLWEIASLGGTPYGNVPDNNEIPEKIIKSLRLPQLSYVGDDLYQIMLDCWQLDCDERPTFANLIESLEQLRENTLMPFLSFNTYSNFQYEQFYPDMEIAVRPIF